MSQEYHEWKKRQRRVQVPPLSCWNDSIEEDEQMATVERVMDFIGISSIALVIVLFIALLAVNGKLYWLFPIAAGLTVVWWLGWGRRKYGE